METASIFNSANCAYYTFYNEKMVNLYSDDVPETLIKNAGLAQEESHEELIVSELPNLDESNPEVEQ